MNTYMYIHIRVYVYMHRYASLSFINPCSLYNENYYFLEYLCFFFRFFNLVIPGKLCRFCYLTSV